jgi:hypothetical protein
MRPTMPPLWPADERDAQAAILHSQATRGSRGHSRRAATSRRLGISLP